MSKSGSGLLGLRVYGLVFRVLRAQGFGWVFFRVFRVWGFGFRRLEVEALGFGVEP